jgi:RNA polymerase primary sigma factor
MRQLKISQRITNRDSSKSFEKYLSDIRSIKSFETPDAEYQCALKAHNGDKDAINELVERNLKFVISVAKQYANSSSPLEELVNEGNYGLMEAAAKFEPSRGFKFISYAVWYIRKNITDYMNRHSRSIRIPINKINELNKLKKEIEKLEQKNERTISSIDLVGLEGSDLNFDNINMLLSLNSMSVSSLDAPFTSDNDSGSMIDVIENSNSLSSDHLVNENDFYKIMESALSGLTYRQKEIITMTYGLNGQEPLSLIEIGERVEMSREGVRQLRKKALKILKINMNRNGFKIEMLNN